MVQDQRRETLTFPLKKKISQHQVPTTLALHSAIELELSGVSDLRKEKDRLKVQERTPLVLEATTRSLWLSLRSLDSMLERN
jgi:hypothetical protein